MRPALARRLAHSSWTPSPTAGRARGRVVGARTVRARLVGLLALATLMPASLLLGTVTPANAASTPTSRVTATKPTTPAGSPSPAQRFPLRNEGAFVGACARSARKAAPTLSSQGVTAYCLCLLQAFEVRYTFAEFDAFDRAARTGKTLTAKQRAFADLATKTCASKIR